MLRAQIAGNNKVRATTNLMEKKGDLRSLDAAKKTFLFEETAIKMKNQFEK